MALLSGEEFTALVGLSVMHIKTKKSVKCLFPGEDEYTALC